MNVALIGADGKVGTRVLAELIRRDHIVTAIVRHPERVAVNSQVTIKQADANDSEKISELFKGQDAIISTLTYKDIRLPDFVAAIRRSGVPRLLVVGNAGSLEAKPGILVVDSPHFPPEHTAQAIAHGELLKLLRAEPTLNWTVLSPPLRFEAGERTGRFRLGKDQLLIDDNGQSKISFEDLAVALVNELENPLHPRQRFTIAY